MTRERESQFESEPKQPLKTALERATERAEEAENIEEVESEPKKQPLKTALERATERAKDIKEVEGEPEENRGAEESIESEIKQLTDDEKKFFELREQRAKKLHEFNWQRSEGIIDVEEQKEMRDEINLSLGEEAILLQEKIGGKRANEIEDLRKKKLDMEVEKEISEAKDFDKLIRAVYKTDGIQGTEEFYRPDQLRGYIDSVIKGEGATNDITRSLGLRKRVRELLELKKEGGRENEGEPKVVGKEGEPKKEREKKEELRRVEVERGPAPWEKMRTEEEGRLIEKYAEKAQLNPKTKDNIESALREEVDRKRIEFAKEWFSEHGDKIKEKGYDVRIADESYMVRVTSELGGFKELKSNEDYKDKNEEIENFYALRTDLQKENIPIESQFLMLNALNKRGERIEGELERAQAAGDNEAVKAKELQLEELFKTGQELTEKVSGRDLRNEADKKIEILAKEEDYVENGIKIKLENKTPLEIRNEASRGLNYTIEKKGFFKKRFEIRDKDGNIIHKVEKEKDLNKFLEGRLREKLAEDFGKEWEIKNQAREGGIRKLIEKEVKDLASSPENAKGGIEAVYGRVKERLITEFVEKDLKKKEKTKEEFKAIEEEFKGQGKNPTEFIDNVIHRKGELAELTGKWEKDEDNFTKFLENWGISADPDFLKEKRIANGYEKAVTKERGFLEWLLDFIFGYISYEAEKSKEGGKGGKKAGRKGK